MNLANDIFFYTKSSLSFMFSC